MCLYGGGGGCGGGGGGGGGVDGSDGGDGVVMRGGESGVYRSCGSSGSGGSSGSVVHWSVGGGLCRSGWCFGVWCGFHGEGGGGSGAGDGVCCEVCCEAGSVVCKREGTFFALLYREIGGNEQAESGGW